MKAHGNGRPETCASNLVRIVRGEVPYDRVRGLDGRLIDQPDAADEAVADIEWLLDTYEPRVTVEDAEAVAEAALTGDFAALVTISGKEEERE